MAFPSTSVLDNFNRSDQQLDTSPNWLANAVSSRFQISTNRIASGTGWTMDAWWGTNSYSLPFEAFMTVFGWSGGDSDNPAGVRAGGHTIDATSYDQDIVDYQFFIYPNSGDLSTSTYELGYGGNSGSPKIFSASTTGLISVADGDVIGIRVQVHPTDSSQIRMTGWLNGVLVDTLDDVISTISPILEGVYDQGFIAPIGYSSAYTFDDFGGGAASLASPVVVKGTIDSNRNLFPFIARQSKRPSLSNGGLSTLHLTDRGSPAPDGGFERYLVPRLHPAFQVVAKTGSLVAGGYIRGKEKHGQVGSTQYYNGLIKDFAPDFGVLDTDYTDLHFDPTSRDWQPEVPIACPQGFIFAWSNTTTHILNGVSDTGTVGSGTARGTWVSGTTYNKYDRTIDPTDGFEYSTRIASPNTSLQPHSNPGSWHRTIDSGFSPRSTDAGFYGSCRANGDATRWFSAEFKRIGRSGATEPTVTGTNDVTDNTCRWTHIPSVLTAWTPGMTVAVGDYIIKDGAWFRNASAGVTGGTEPSWSTTGYNNSVGDNDAFWTRRYVDAGTWQPNTDYAFRVVSGATIVQGGNNVARCAVMMSNGTGLFLLAIAGTDALTGSTEPAWSAAASGSFWEDNELIWRFGSFAANDPTLQSERLVLSGLVAASNGKTVIIHNDAAPGSKIDVVLADKAVTDAGGVANLTGTDKESVHGFDFGGPGQNVVLTEGQSVTLVYSTSTGYWSVATSGTTSNKTGSITASGLLSGADVAEHPEAGSVMAFALISGVEVFILNKTGSITTFGLLSGADATTHQETGSVLTSALTSGADVATHVETGSVTVFGLVSGADAATHAETGTIMVFGLVSGADTAEHPETGTIQASVLVSGADASTFSDSGSVTTQGMISGADVYTSVEAGTIMASQALLSGASARAGTHTGSVTTQGMLSGVEEFSSSKTGSVIASAVTSGADVSTFSETATVACTGLVSGPDATTRVESGSVTTQGLVSGVDAATTGHTGSITTQGFLAGFAIKTVPGKSGSLVAAGLLSGADTAEHWEAGTLIADAWISGADVTTHSETGLLAAATWVSAADTSIRNRTGSITTKATPSGVSFRAFVHTGFKAVGKLTILNKIKGSLSILSHTRGRIK